MDRQSESVNRFPAPRRLRLTPTDGEGRGPEQGSDQRDLQTHPEDRDPADPREGLWGTNLLIRTDKTGIASYAGDTPIASQLPMPTPSTTTDYQRACYNENAEKTSGGNGLGGHDETSENLGANWIVAPLSLGIRTPGSYP